MVGSRARALVAGLLLVVATVTGCTPAAASPVTVMTRNLYLGADILRPVRAAQGLTGTEALLALGHANHQLRAVVDQTDFGVRGRLLAAEIAGARPDLVGLQEVALWRHGPLELDHLGRLDASEVDLDFLAILLADLTARGVGYRVVQAQSESDVEAPAFSGNPLAGGTGSAGAAGSARDIRLTMRDVILVRDDSAATIRASGSGQFAARFDLPLGGVPFPFLRGYAWVDVAVGPAQFRFVTTHLESESADLALAQARELLAGPAAATGSTTVLVCDCNSDPATTAPQPGHLAADSAVYELLTSGGALQDLGRAEGGDPSPTALFSEGLRDPDVAGLNRRLDLVLARPGRAGSVEPVRSEVVGSESADRDPATGLWPSDHAGVVAELRVR